MNLDQHLLRFISENVRFFEMLSLLKINGIISSILELSSYLKTLTDSRHLEKNNVTESNSLYQERTKVQRIFKADLIKQTKLLRKIKYVFIFYEYVEFVLEFLLN